MFERIDREADGEVYVNEVLDFLRSISSDLDQVGQDNCNWLYFENINDEVAHTLHFRRVRM